MTLLWPSSAKASERSTCDQEQHNGIPNKTSPARQGLVHGGAAGDKESWSTAIIGMVNSLRPLARQSKSPTRRSGRTPEELPQQNQQQQYSNSSHFLHSDVLSSDHHAAASPVSSVGDGDRSAKRIKLTVKGTPRTSLPRRTDVDGAVTPRPPTKLTISAPHGNLTQTTNGVRTTIDLTDDSLHNGVSAATTPDPSAPGSAVSQGPGRDKKERRSLRSQNEGSRLKSELAVYFPNYDSVINDVPTEIELLTVDSEIYISNEPYFPPQQQAKAGASREDHHVRRSSKVSPIKSPPSSERNRFNGAQVIDFSSIEKSVGHHPKDPLTDAFYFKSHRRAERKEKQLRNIEKERAMHEKAQLERLLDGLQGHDWLRVLGVTGVTDSEAKKYEPKRDYFASEVKSLLHKFKTWKEEERRLKLEKEAAAFAEEGDEEDDDEHDEGHHKVVLAGQAVAGATDIELGSFSSDVDASAARQLQLETSVNNKAKGKSKLVHISAPPTPAPPPALPIIYRPPTPEGPFLSFYAKPHLRAAALGKARHGRNMTAFGQPVPELEEDEFTLPDDYITEDVLKDNARRRRRMKRESAVDASEKKS